MPPVHGPAVCIRQWDWSETSQTVSLFTRHHGVVRALAKGARRPNAPFSGGLELLTLGEAGLIIKPATELALLTDWDLRASHAHLRRSLPASLAGQHCADIVQALVLDQDPHRELFDALLAALAAMARPEAVAGALAGFQAAALVHAGLWPVLDRFVDEPESAAGADPGREIPPGRVMLFDPRRAGLVSADVPPLHTLPGGGAAWRVRGETVALLRLLGAAAREWGGAKPDAPMPAATPATTSGTAAATTPAMVTVPAQAAERAGRLLAAYLRHVLGRDLPTLPLVYPGLSTGLNGARDGQTGQAGPLGHSRGQGAAPVAPRGRPASRPL
jgi:hypothetical protein